MVCRLNYKTLLASGLLCALPTLAVTLNVQAPSNPMCWRNPV